LTVFFLSALATSENSQILEKKYFQASGVVGGSTGSASPCRFQSQLSALFNDIVQQQLLHMVPLQVVHAMILKGERINFPHKIMQHEVQIHTWEGTNTKFFFGLFIDIPIYPV
jgi:hypothetical protein